MALTKKNLQEGAEVLSRWVSTNAGFMIFGKSLLQLILQEDHDVHLHSVNITRHCQRAWYRGWRVRQIPLGSQWTKLLRKEYDHIERLLRLNMRLSVGDFGLAWADEKALAGGIVVQLDGSDVSVILRRRRRGGWNLVGDAVVYRPYHNQHIRRHKPESFKIY